MSNQAVQSLTDQYVTHTYARFPIALVKGAGTRVWDADGKVYLDFVAGIAVNSLGHCHPAVVRAIEEQARTLMHVSNLYYIEPQARLARELCSHSFADRVFFCNSGAEANEAAIKLARRYGSERHRGKYEIITALNSFHGRTLATLTATGQEKIRLGFDPLPTGFRYVPYNNLDAVADAVGERTVAVLIEPIQGEGGIVVPSVEYMRGLRKLCNERDLLLIFDEVQTGMGRTGKLFAYEHFGIEPDVMTLAKALGGGVPLGAMLAREDVARSFGPGSHASTFGGNPLVCRAGLAVIETIMGENLLGNCVERGDQLREGLERLVRRFGFLREVRGKGLIAGVALDRECAPIVRACLAEGLLVVPAGANVLRMVPPLVVSEADVDEALGILERVMRQV
jgi:predicted acetylornithine/succinylornithine family transaminase